jgi:hypothetical protein
MLPTAPLIGTFFSKDATAFVMGLSETWERKTGIPKSPAVSPPVASLHP